MSLSTATLKSGAAGPAHNWQDAVAPPARNTGSQVAATARKMSVVVVREFEALAAYIPAWEALAEGALEPNVFYEPWMLLPALKAFSGGKDLYYVLIFTPDPLRPSGPQTLCGFFPLERRPRFKGIPAAHFALWKHEYSVLCTPLIKADCGRECLGAFLDWLSSDTKSAALMEFGFIPGEGPFYHLLVDCFNERAIIAFGSECFTRALFRPRTDGDQYMRVALSGRRRKELRRKANRLSDMGQVQYIALEPGQSAAEWIEDFLTLEAAGWKGQQGSAVACKEADREFFQAVAMEAHRRGRLMMLATRLEGKPISMKCNFLAGEGAFAFKIAFDEQYAQFSPGVLLEIDNIHRLHREPGLKWMDSCAIADHFMINRLWLDRRTIQTVLVATGRGAGDFIVSLLPLLRWLNRKLRRRRVSK